jgi:hypothetical protein
VTVMNWITIATLFITLADLTFSVMGWWKSR